jgi:hypothetical protein
MELFASAASGPGNDWDSVDQALDAINIKYGRDTINRANLRGPSRKP